jgi:hypothetical protein
LLLSATRKARIGFWRGSRGVQTLVIKCSSVWSFRQGGGNALNNKVVKGFNKMASIWRLQKNSAARSYFVWFRHCVYTFSMSICENDIKVSCNKL